MTTEKEFLESVVWYLTDWLEHADENNLDAVDLLIFNINDRIKELKLRKSKNKKKKVSKKIKETNKTIKKPIVIRFRRTDGTIAKLNATKLVKKPVKVKLKRRKK